MQSTDPHCQLVLYNILLAYGRRKSEFLRSHKRWRPVIPLLMDHVLLQLDLDIDYAFGGATSRGLATPIEVKLQLFSIGILYEVCRVQKLSIQDLSTCNASPTSLPHPNFSQRYSTTPSSSTCSNWSRRHEINKTKRSTTPSSSSSYVSPSFA